MNRLYPLLLIASVLVLGFSASAQVKLGNNPNTIGAGSILELESTNKAFLPPRMTTAQRNAIASPVEGMTIYNLTTACNNVYQGGAWFDQCAFNRALTGKQRLNGLLGGSGDDFVRDIRQTSDGGYIVIGSSASSASGDVTGANHGDEDLWVVKLDAGGAISWNKLFGGNDDDDAASVQQTADGGYIIAGYSSSSASGDVSDVNHGDVDEWIIKLDASGNMVWNRLLGGSLTDDAISIVQTTDGGYAVAGASLSSATGDVTGTSHGNTDFWVVKLDASGNTTWNKLIGGAGDEVARDIRQTADGGYIISGHSNSSASGDITAISHGNNDLLVVKLDGAGNILWNKLYGGNLNEQRNYIEQTADGGYILAGNSLSSASGDVSGSNHGINDYWIVKLDMNGNIAWNKLLGGSGGDFPQSVQQTSDGGYIIAGTSGSSASGDVTPTNNGSTDIWIVKLDPSGNTLWTRLVGGSQAEGTGLIRLTSDNGFILAGNTNSSTSGDVKGSNHGNYDFWLLKLNSLGAIVQ